MVETRRGCSLKGAGVGKPSQKMFMASERLFLSSAKVHVASLDNLAHQQKPQEPRRRDSWKERVVGCSGDSVWDPVRRVEKFARVFMLVVFMIFNVIYWIIAYAY